VLEIKRLFGEKGAMLALRGELDLSTVGYFTQALEQALHQHNSVILNLEGLAFLDSSGVGGLMRALNKARAGGKTVSVAGVRPEVNEVFEIMGLKETLRGMWVEE